jgi:hypothetical protein
MTASQEFLDSLYDSEGAFVDAIYREEKNGFNFEDTLDRKYEEGFIDGMRHAYTLLTGDTLLGDSPSEFEATSRANIREELAKGAEFCECDQDCLKKQCKMTGLMVKHCTCTACLAQQAKVELMAGKITVTRGSL